MIQKLAAFLVIGLVSALGANASEAIDYGDLGEKPMFRLRISQNNAKIDELNTTDQTLMIKGWEYRLWSERSFLTCKLIAAKDTEVKNYQVKRDVEVLFVYLFPRNIGDSAGGLTLETELPAPKGFTPIKLKDALAVHAERDIAGKSLLEVINLLDEK